MRFRTALSIASLFLVCFTLAVWATPLDAKHPLTTDPEPEVQSITGKVASVGDAEFALEVRKDQQAVKVKFLVDGNTKIEGKLSIGAHAIVEYRSEGGYNIATRISVLASSGLHS